MQHVATWKEGDEKWAYHEDAFKNIATHKVSLDPYRRESRKILEIIKDVLPAPPLQRVEKASVDEVFVDLSAQIHTILLERYPELKGPPPYDDPTEKLPAPPTTVLDWNADALVDLDENHTEEDAPDWDDIAMLVGSEIVRHVRASILERLKYTCSAGVARNKMLAKLGSGHKKPNSQTIIRNRAIQHFLNDFKFTKIRNLGGKLGDEAVNMFGTDTVKALLEVPLEQLKRLGDDTGMWLHQTIRGEDHTEVNSRTQIKSMLSAKSFRPTINTFDQAVRWLRIFAADIFSRLVEEGVTENKRRPKTLNLHHRQGAQTRSRQAPIPQGKPIDESTLYDLAKNLLAQIIVDGRAWPCANLSLSVGGFEDGPTGNHGIGGFLVRGEEAKAMQPVSRTNDGTASITSCDRPKKRQRVTEARINNFFVKQENSVDQDLDFDDIPSGQPGIDTDLYSDEIKCPPTEQTDLNLHQTSDGLESDVEGDSPNDSEDFGFGAAPKTEAQTTSTFICPKCQKSLLEDQKEEHEDWHFAQELQRQERGRTVPPQKSTPGPQPPPPPKQTHKAGRGRGRPPSSGITRVEKGQSRLAFGK